MLWSKIQKHFINFPLTSSEGLMPPADIVITQFAKLIIEVALTWNDYQAYYLMWAFHNYNMYITQYFQICTFVLENGLWNAFYKMLIPVYITGKFKLLKLLLIFYRSAWNMVITSLKHNFVINIIIPL